ncbi:hypothetical protein D9M68_672660 [compost metagenome]
MVDGKLTEAQGLLGLLALAQLLAYAEQLTLQATALLTQMQNDGRGAEQGQQQQQREAAPEGQGFADLRVFQRQPALAQTLDLAPGHGLQGPLEDFRQQRLVAPTGDAQQLRQADIADDAQGRELRLAQQQAEARLVDHRVADLLAQQAQQAHPLRTHRLQAQIVVGLVQVLEHGARLAHRDQLIVPQAVEVDRADAALLAHHQVRHPHVGRGIEPQTQAARGLLQPRREIDLAAAHRPIQLVLLGETHPQRLDPHALQHAGHQLDVGPGKPLQAPVIQGPGRLHEQAHAQLPMLGEPGLLLDRVERTQRFQRAVSPGKQRPQQQYNEDARPDRTHAKVTLPGQRDRIHTLPQSRPDSPRDSADNAPCKQ